VAEAIVAFTETGAFLAGVLARFISIFLTGVALVAAFLGATFLATALAGLAGFEAFLATVLLAFGAAFLGLAAALAFAGFLAALVFLVVLAMIKELCWFKKVGRKITFARIKTKNYRELIPCISEAIISIFRLLNFTTV
jgi:hypothetical protein